MKFRVGVPFLAVSMALSCALLDQLRRPPRAPAAEADRVVFSLYAPRSTVHLDGLKLRAAAMALADFLPEPGSEAMSCYERESSYDVRVWMAEGASPDSGCPWPDAGIHLPDGGYEVMEPLLSDQTCDTLYGTPGLVYVDIFLRPGVCDDGGEIIVDQGGTYAIDVKKWRIAAAHR